MWSQIDTHNPRRAARRKPSERWTEPRVEQLEDRTVPATIAGPTQLQAAQLVTAIAVSTEAAFEANYKVFSSSATVFQLSNLISAYLHSSQDALAASIRAPQQNPTAVAVMNQSLGYVTAEINVLEAWYFDVTSQGTDTNLVLRQLQALTNSFLATEQAATPIQVEELASGIIVNSSAFTYIPPAFISPSGGGVATPASASITGPAFTVSSMNNDQIRQFSSIASNSLLLTTAAISTSVAQPLVNQPFTVNVQVAPVIAGVGLPTGAVTLSVDGNAVGTAQLNGNGVAVFNTQLNSAGLHRLTAVYLGNSVFQPSTNTLAITAV